MVNVKEANGLVLAYWGDAVWELLVREHGISKGYNISNLNRYCKKFVHAKIQSMMLQKIYPLLEKEDAEIVKRAKNSNIKTFPKSCTVMEYKEATAFEALIAILYERGEIGKIRDIIKEMEEII
ncbi:MAG: Mini-ribonuclease 3 [Fusobacteriaceae bacterium]